MTSNALLKLKGSYREPKTDAEVEREEKAAAVALSREGQYKCAHGRCGRWQPENWRNMEEADDARGCSIKCKYCGRLSWKGIGQETWFPKYRNGRSGEGGYY